VADNITDFTIRPLSEGDCKSPFCLDKDKSDLPLKIFFRKDAKKAGVEFITKSYVAIPTNPDDVRILGYISIMSAEISLLGSYNIPNKPRADRYPSQPAVRIARLAVADDCQGSGIGSDLVSLAVSISLDQIVPFVGCRFIVVNAKQKSIAFYTKRGFTLLETEANTSNPAPIMWLDLKLLSNGTE
jgi:ribosomal protein S18 acetylase RimI-like enzyme